RPGGAGVLDEADVVASSRGAADGGLDAAVGDDPADDEVPDAEVAQDVVEVGAVEDAAASLGDDDLVADRRHLLEDLRPLRAGRAARCPDRAGPAGARAGAGRGGGGARRRVGPGSTLVPRASLQSR